MTEPHDHEHPEGYIHPDEPPAIEDGLQPYADPDAQPVEVDHDCTLEPIQRDAMGRPVLTPDDEKLCVCGHPQHAPHPVAEEPEVVVEPVLDTHEHHSHEH